VTHESRRRGQIRCIAAVSVSMVKEAKGWWDLEACSN